MAGGGVQNLSPGQQVVGHELLEVLGRGASATVFRARAPTGEQVALKLRRAGDPGMDKRFLREFESIRRLRLENVVRVVDAGQSPQFTWYSMEIVRGQTLRRYIQSAASMAERTLRACEAGTQLADALASMHQAGFVHRDLKPSNVMVTDSGEVRILDFGVVQWWAVSESLTGSGGLVGTPSFMSPEAIGGLPVTGAADVFALGLMLYEGLVGRRERPKQAAGWLARQVLQRVPPAASVDPRCPRDLSTVIDHCLRFDPSARPTARALAELLRGCLDGSSPAEWPNPPVFAGRRVELQLLETALQGKSARISVLLGDAGSGKRRLQEQACRRALLRGTRTLVGRCLPEAPGHPLGMWLSQLLSAPNKTPWREELVGDGSGALLQLWPHLPLHMLSDRPAGEASERDVLQAALGSFARAAAHTPLVLVLHDAHHLDPLSSKFLRRLLRRGDPRIHLLALADPRRMGARAERMLEHVEGLEQGQILRMAPLPPRETKALCASLLPEGAPSVSPGAATPLQATQAALRALAELRAEPFYELPPKAAPLAVARRPLPRDVLEAWLGDAGPFISKGFVVETLVGKLRLPEGNFQTATNAALQDAAAAHRDLAHAWETEGRSRNRWIEIAHHRLAAGSPKAWEACVRGADAAQRLGRYTQARQLLLVLDTLKQDRNSETYRRFRFDLAFSRARVAARTDAERPRQDLVDAARARAINAEQLHLSTLLQAELHLRNGLPNEALSLAHDTARAAQLDHPEAAAALWLCCAQAWMEVGAWDKARWCAEAAGELADTAPLLRVEAEAACVESLLVQGELTGLAQRSRAGLRAARRLEHAGAEAWHLRNLGVAWMRSGRRRASEDMLASARELYVRNSDLAGAATTSLQLAALAIGRGEPAIAERWLTDGLAVARKLKLARLEPLAATVELDLGVQTGDPIMSRKATERVGAQRSSWGWRLANLRWLRAQGDIEAATVEATTLPTRGYSGALGRMEVARIHLDDGSRPTATVLLQQGLQIARAEGLEELELYGLLLEGVLFPDEVHDWGNRCARALSSTWVELFLGVLEFDARYLMAHGEHDEAVKRLRSLRSRAADIGNRPYARVALELLRDLS